MPLFFQNSRQKESTTSFGPRDDLLVGSLRHCRSDAALTDRPRTAGGAVNRKFNGPSLQPLMPLPPPSARPYSTATKTTSVLVPVRSSVYDQGLAQGLGIGVALGSPSEAQPPPFTFPSFENVSRVEPAPAEPAPEQHHAEPVSQETSERAEESPGKPKVARWKTVSGLFARRKATNAISSPLSRISEDSAATPEAPAARISDDRSRRSLYLKRGRKPRLSPPPLEDGGSNAKAGVATPTPGEARAFEAAEPHVGPTLDISIPKSDFDRYSVMFSNLLPEASSEARQPRQSLLARRQGVESLTITSPGFAPKPGVAPFVPAKDVSYENVSEELAATKSPARTFSPEPHPSQYRLSAIPAPLFAQKHHKLKKSQSAIDLQTVNASLSSIARATPESPQPATYPSTPCLAFLSDSPPDSPATDADTYSPRGSSQSTVSTGHFPPSPTSSTYSYHFPMAASFARSPNSPTTSKSPLSAAETDPDRAQHYLSVPTSNSHSPVVPPGTPWAENFASAFPSPLLPSSPSPRMKYGYDTPHSPLLAIARSVTVCVRAGQGKAQQPQFVVRERGGGGRWGCAARSAVFVD